MQTENQLTELSSKVGQYLLATQKTVACAESCTGGWIAKAITDIAGSSSYFECGFVTYSNEAKKTMLGVSSSTLDAYGAVSEHVVKAMARGVLREANSDYGLSVSGIAGPGGGSEDKPVGTVWFGFAWKDDEGKIMTQAVRQQFQGDRITVRFQSTFFSLDTFFEKILKKPLDTV